MDLHLVNDLMWKFGLPAIFLLTMAEGDITLLLAGGLAHGQAFGDYSYLQGIAGGALAGGGGGKVGYAPGGARRPRGQRYCFLFAARPRAQRVTPEVRAPSPFFP